MNIQHFCQNSNNLIFQLLVVSISTTSIKANQVSLQFGDADDFVGDDVEALVVIAVILIELSE